MKIVTINIPESYIDAINKLVGVNGLYPSRSELIRVAVREFLIKEISFYEQGLKALQNAKDDPTIIRIPNGDGTYKELHRIGEA